jgi:glycosyltransferase involved in cell wall biosynthesis
MKVIGLVPVRNEAWVLPHSLASLSGFCDVVIVSDQNSDDRSREICRSFAKVVLLESSECVISTRVRWQLLDAARDYDGCNLLWCTDADELIAPRAARDFIAARRDDLEPGTVVECMFLHLWQSASRYREYHWGYGPHFKPLALVDDRRMDYDRTRRNSIHEPRVPLDGAVATLRADGLHVLHLQWLLAERTQMRQAWYRCREWLDGRPSAVINENYSVTLPDASVRTADVPAAWTEGLTFPDLAIDREQSWNERDILAWFDERTPEFFEPLEIWHIPVLRERFEHRAGRRPRPDRSYRASWPARARHFGRRVAAAARRRLGFTDESSRL